VLFGNFVVFETILVRISLIGCSWNDVVVVVAVVVVVECS
jgi:hypothetical protein